MWWNVSKQDFDLYIPNAPDFAINRGEGFFIAVNEESVWHGNVDENRNKGSFNEKVDMEFEFPYPPSFLQ